MAVIIEPFRIKSVEPIRVLTLAERKEKLEQACYNTFLLEADDVLIDLLTDSGTSAMSSAQWAGMMIGDESYAGSKSFYHFEKTVQEITGMQYVIPTHQGRAAEKILFSVTGGPGKVFISNTLFDTTRANIEYTGATGIDMLCAEGKQPLVSAPFKGNLDTEALEVYIRNHGAGAIAMVITTVTNNSGGGQPVSMMNIKQTATICKQHGIPFFIDACR
ncbi:MAG TPA: tryptophanase, partial [Ferruginibacter sp.]|nr:tryptophanase [Ferruginibacter sp.]